MANTRKPAPRGMDRLERMTKSSVRAGKSKSSLAARRAANRGVKDGQIKLGKSGKHYNVYDAKTATWKRGVVKAASKSSGSSKPKMTGRGGYGSTADRPKQPKLRKFAGGTSKQYYETPSNKPIFDIPAYFRKTDSDRRRSRALGAAKVVAKRPTGARAQSAVYRATRRKKK